MLGSTAIKRVLESIVNPTLRVRVEKLHAFWDKLAADAAGWGPLRVQQQQQQRYQGVDIGALQWCVLDHLSARTWVSAVSEREVE